MIKPLMATLVYTVLTFAVAVGWHIVAFHELYFSWRYFGEHPGYLLGFLSILIQGGILSFVYHWLNVSKWRYVLVVGIFHWTIHVLAFMAKEEAARTFGFLALESVYLAIQFGLYGLVLRVVWRR